MVRFLIIVAVTFVGIALAGCSQQAGSAPSESTQGAVGSPPAGSADLTLAPGTAQECPPNAECAPTNDHAVRDVVGMTVTEAYRTLSRSGYACAIWAQRSGDHTGLRRVVAQKEKPGSKGYAGQLVHLTVSKSYPEGYYHPRKGLLPPDCVDQRDYPR
jgi:PASTA domain-containing protein